METKPTMMHLLDHPTEVENQIAFINDRIATLKKEIQVSGDFGRSALIAMFTQIIISISNRMSDPGFTEQVLRKLKESSDLIRQYSRHVDNRNMRDATGVLMKIKKASKELDALLEKHLNPES